MQWAVLVKLPPLLRSQVTDCPRSPHNRHCPILQVPSVWQLDLESSKGTFVNSFDMQSKIWFILCIFILPVQTMLCAPVETSYIQSLASEQTLRVVCLDKLNSFGEALQVWALAGLNTLGEESIIWSRELRLVTSRARARVLAKFTPIHHWEGGELKSGRKRFFLGKCISGCFCMTLEQNNKLGV